MTTIVKDIALKQTATGGQTGVIAEPSVASSGQRIFMTGNWFASRSTSGGSRWKFIDPYTELPPASTGFCCDQRVLYVKSKRLWIWLLQYAKSSNGNTFRIAVSSTGKPGTWTWWDTAPQDVDARWNKVWFDYPDIVATKKHLLVSFNVFSVSTNRWLRAVVLRFSLEELKQRESINRQVWFTESFGSLRFTKGVTDKAYFGSLSYSEASIEVFSWPDNKDTVSQKTVNVSDWNYGPYDSAGPDGVQWLSRLDDRVTAAWCAKGVIGFAWSASADENHPHPYIRVVRINQKTKKLMDEPDIWSADRAWAYPVMSPNRRGDVGVAGFCGGADLHPAHGLGSFDEKTKTWHMTVGSVSSHGPWNSAWGDYIDLQADPSRKTYWIASGFTLRGGPHRINVEPHVVWFKP